MAIYDFLIWYSSKVMERILGSIAIIEKDSDPFRWPFLSFHVCVVGFKSGCKPLLFIDGTHLLRKYGAPYWVQRVRMGITASSFHICYR